MNLEELEALRAAAVQRTGETWTLCLEAERSEGNEGDEDACSIPETMTKYLSDYDAPGRSAVEWQVAIHAAFPALAAEIRKLREERDKLRKALAGLVSPDAPADMDRAETIDAMTAGVLALRARVDGRSAAQALAALEALKATLPKEETT